LVLIILSVLGNETESKGKIIYKLLAGESIVKLNNVVADLSGNTKIYYLYLENFYDNLHKNSSMLQEFLPFNKGTEENIQIPVNDFKELLKKYIDLDVLDEECDGIINKFFLEKHSKLVSLKSVQIFYRPKVEMIVKHNSLLSN
jgi:hypothetical protein